MSEEIRVDPALFPSIAEYYQRQRVDLGKTKTYLVQNCTLDDAMGILLGGFQPQYNDARDQMFAAVDAFDLSIGGLAEQAKGYIADAEATEADIDAQIADLNARVAELEAVIADTQISNNGGGNDGGGGTGGGSGGGTGGGSGGGTGGGSGGGTGGGSGGGSPAPAPTPTPEPADEEEPLPEIAPPEVGDVPDPTMPEPTTPEGDGAGDGADGGGADGGGADDGGADDGGTGSGDGGSAEDGGDSDGSAEGTPGDGTPGDGTPGDGLPGDDDPEDGLPGDTDPDGATPGEDADGDEGGDTIINIVIDGDGNTIVIGDQSGVEVNPEIADERAAAESARESAFYERVWEEKAASDPLGRSADDLRLAWEAREPIPIDDIPVMESGIGYAEMPLNATADRVNFGILPDATPLIGAAR